MYNIPKTYHMGGEKVLDIILHMIAHMKLFPIFDTIRKLRITVLRKFDYLSTLEWRHNGRGGISNHQPHDCLLNRLFRPDQRKHQSSASLAFVRGIHRWPVNSPHKWPEKRKMFIMNIPNSMLLKFISLFCERAIAQRKWSRSSETA